MPRVTRTVVNVAATRFNASQLSYRAKQYRRIPVGGKVASNEAAERRVAALDKAMDIKKAMFRRPCSIGGYFSWCVYLKAHEVDNYAKYIGGEFVRWVD